MFTGYRITSPYGWRIHPIDRVRKFHTGVDLVKTPKNAPIPAFVSGMVIWAKWGSSGTGYGGFGNVVVIRDEYNHNHLYCHLQRISVKEGQFTAKDQEIGLQGTTGISTWEHLHYEVRTGGFGTHINPEKYLISYWQKKRNSNTCIVILDNKYLGLGILQNGRSYLPVRALENTKYQVVHWDGESKIVYLKSV